MVKLYLEVKCWNHPLNRLRFLGKRESRGLVSHVANPKDSEGASLLLESRVLESAVQCNVTAAL
jgi:hypothetical protein